MPPFKLIVLSNPVEGQDDEFNEWYTNTHVPELLSVDGVLGAERLRLKLGVDTWRYLAIYEIDAKDPATVVADMRKRIESGEFKHSAAFNVATAYNALFEPIPAKK